MIGSTGYEQVIINPKEHCQALKHLPNVVCFTVLIKIKRWEESWRMRLAA